MKRLTMAFLCFVSLAACRTGDEDRPYDNNELQLVAGYNAKSQCSCRFVMDQDKAFCDAWVHQNPDIALLNIDEEAKTVTAYALTVSRTARFVNARVGCTME